MPKSAKKSLNVELTVQLRRYIDEKTDGNGLYATPSEYIRDLIRQDMENHAVVQHVGKGLDDAKKGRFSARSILDIAAGK